jgi:hypothetical protein
MQGLQKRIGRVIYAPTHRLARRLLEGMAPDDAESAWKSPRIVAAEPCQDKALGHHGE